MNSSDSAASLQTCAWTSPACSARPAAALAAADVGIALGSGTEVAMQAAAVTLMRSDLRLVAALIDSLRRSTRMIRQNLFWAFVYNVVGILLAALGLLNPITSLAAICIRSRPPSSVLRNGAAQGLVRGRGRAIAQGLLPGGQGAASLRSGEALTGVNVAAQRASTQSAVVICEAAH